MPYKKRDGDAPIKKNSTLNTALRQKQSEKRFKTSNRTSQTDKAIQTTNVKTMQNSQNPTFQIASNNSHSK